MSIELNRRIGCQFEKLFFKLFFYNILSIERNRRIGCQFEKLFFKPFFYNILQQGKYFVS